jgi:integration host factor subunit beta
MNITKAYLCQRVSHRSDYKSVEEIRKIVDFFLDEIIMALAAEQRIEIRGFGSYSVKNRKTKIARNPRTGESVIVPAYKKPIFKFSDEAYKKFKTVLEKPKDPIS